MNDFDKWYVWQLEYGKNPILNRKAAEMHYNNMYDCDCHTCKYRKEHGFMPIKLSPNCRLNV